MLRPMRECRSKRIWWDASTTVIVRVGDESISLFRLMVDEKMETAYYDATAMHSPTCRTPVPNPSYKIPSPRLRRPRRLTTSRPTVIHSMSVLCHGNRVVVDVSRTSSGPKKKRQLQQYALPSRTTVVSQDLRNCVACLLDFPTP